MIIAIEGIDGAGKNTLVTRLRAELAPRGVDVEVLAFPRYDESVHAQLARDALYGRMGDMTDSAYAMATLFALDRYGARDRLAEAASSDRLVLLDRYVASNAAYTAARLDDVAVIDWVEALEFDRLGLPTPALQVFLDTDVSLARQRAHSRAQADQLREKDEYEKDATLQERTAAMYRLLARQNWVSRWIATADTGMISKTVHDLVHDLILNNAGE